MQERFPKREPSAFGRPTEIATTSDGEGKSAMMIELPEKLEAALKFHANANGVSPAGYVCEVLEPDLASTRCAFRGRLSVVVQFGFFPRCIFVVLSRK
jgi:hypothetical protein